MAKKEIDRKVAIILATDVVNYSKHMETNESETVKNLRACELILQRVIKKHDGRLFNSGGDSFFVEFPSAVEAVECAVAFQKDIKKRNSSDIITVPLEFRIGISMGDVIKEKENLLGDGVNIAARLEALAQTNGITISKNIYDLVKAKTSHKYNDLGVQKVKKNEFHAYDILLDPSQKRKLKTKSSSMTPTIGGIVAILIVGIIGLIYFSSTSDKEILANKRKDTSVPTILVAPIDAKGLSENQKGFANGITESMISTFSSFKGVRVLSSNTSYHTVKNKMTDQDIRDEYGVNFIIRGSMQVIGDNARLNLQMSDLETSTISVSKKKDFALTNIFNVQDELSNEILSELSTNLGVGITQGSNWAKDFNSMEDFILFLNWREEYRKFNKKSYIKSLKIFEELRPSYINQNVTVVVMEAWQLYQKLLFQLSTDETQDIDRLNFVLNLAIKIDPLSFDALAARALIGIDKLNRSCQESVTDIEKALKIGFTVDTLTTAGIVYERCRDSKSAIKVKRDALTLVPNDSGWFITSSLVFSLYKDNQISEIYNLIGQDIESEDMSARVLALYAFLEKEKGNIKKAKKYLERAKEKNFNVKKFERQFRPDQRPLLEKTIDGLLKIGSLE